MRAIISLFLFLAPVFSFYHPVPYFLENPCRMAALDPSPSSKKTKLFATSSLDVLSSHTVIVADTGDVDAIRAQRPTDATTNPSLIYKAAIMPAYEGLVKTSLAYGKGDLGKTMDKLAVAFGKEIAGIVPGNV